MRSRDTTAPRQYVADSHHKKRTVKPKPIREFNAQWNESHLVGRQPRRTEMKKHRFVYEGDGEPTIDMETIDAMCWLYAEQASLDWGIPQEEGADRIKQLIFEGRFIIEFDKKRDRARLVLAPSLAKHWGANAAITVDRHKASLAVIELLAETYPRCFQTYEGRRRPLKVGIHTDIIAALNGVATVREIGLALRIYTGNAGYLLACKRGAPRIDLDGNVAGSVTAEEADQAKQRLEQQRIRRQRRREALAKAKAAEERRIRNASRISWGDLTAMAKARREAKSAAAWTNGDKDYERDRADTTRIRRLRHQERDQGPDRLRHCGSAYEYH
jgi:sRNA-binding protein